MKKDYKPIIIFSDLDKTLFHSKNYTDRFKIGAYKKHSNGKLGSYSHMSEKQKLLFDMFYQNEKVLFIPVTARNEEQYKRTFINMENLVKTYIHSFTTLYIDNKEEVDFNKNIFNKIRKLDKEMNDIVEKMSNIYKSFQNINIRRNTNFIQIVTDNDKFIKSNIEECIIPLLKNSNKLEYSISGKNIYIKPRILDKREPVKYIIEKLKPKLTIGIGDDILDHNFMNETDFKLLPNDSSYVEKLNYLLRN